MQQYLSASRRFCDLINHLGDLPNNRSWDGYDRVKLVRLTYEFALFEESKGNFLRALFEVADIPINGDEIDLDDADRWVQIQDSITDFADYLFENFFLPRILSHFYLQVVNIYVDLSFAVKVSTKKTPQPSPASTVQCKGLKIEKAISSLGLQNVSLLSVAFA